MNPTIGRYHIVNHEFKFVTPSLIPTYSLIVQLWLSLGNMIELFHWTNQDEQTKLTPLQIYPPQISSRSNTDVC